MAYFLAFSAVKKESDVYLVSVLKYHYMCNTRIIKGGGDGMKGMYDEHHTNFFILRQPQPLCSGLVHGLVCMHVPHLSAKHL